MLMGRSLRAPEELRLSAGRGLPYRSIKALLCQPQQQQVELCSLCSAHAQLAL